MDNDRIRLYQKALEKWGSELQILLCIEELSELTKELACFKRSKFDKLAVAEEIADVIIMIEQIINALNLESPVDFYIKNKIERLEERLDL